MYIPEARILFIFTYFLVAHKRLEGRIVSSPPFVAYGTKWVRFWRINGDQSSLFVSPDTMILVFTSVDTFFVTYATARQYQQDFQE